MENEFYVFFKNDFQVISFLSFFLDSVYSDHTQNCVCPANHDPVCSITGHTFSNLCDLNCK